MRYITDRKRAVGKGSAHTGAEHHWFMIVSSVALAFMMPAWIFIFGNALGSGYDAALATMSRPFPAILTALVVFGGKEYGSGSSRDWAAKGTNLLGVKAA